MKRLRARIKNFFLPPEGSPVWLRLLPFGVLGLLTIILLTGSAYVWDYTNSPKFCGTTCHTMPPEYTAYEVSPHAHIDCVDCHLGKGFIATRITRKAGDLKHVTATLFKNYEFPIRATELRPARETCELCHYPEKFSDDSLVEIHRYQNDIENTPISIFLDLKTGGGSERQGLGRGIHWHIENKIQYLPSDLEEQQIPYVVVTNSDGSQTSYVDVESGIKPEDVDKSQLKEMDCITCHNRITHLVDSPEDTVDRLIARGEISAKIPEIRRKAVEVYSQILDTTAAGVSNIAGLDGYYRVYYPEFYNQNKDLVAKAVQSLQDAYGASVFPEQNSNWATHPNNAGHKDSPGCFRCHDGKHLNSDQQAIRLECNLCHSVPVVAGPTNYVARVEISRGPEPSSHRSANWISMHNQVYNDTCQNCHTVDDPGGTSNTSFCSNSACHGNTWKFAGFDAPALRQVIQAQLPPTPTPMPLPTGGALTYDGSIGPLLKARCSTCHGATAMQGLNVTTYAGLMAGSKNGPVIVPGDANNSRIVQKQSGPQPHFAQLPAQELDLLIQWINAGAPEK